MQGSGRPGTGPRGLRNTFMIRYEQELHQACASNDLEKVWTWEACSSEDHFCHVLSTVVTGAGNG